MIESVKIENFKCFRELAINGLTRVTLIGGANNVGKTSVLEAIGMYFWRMNAGIFLQQLAWRGVAQIAGQPKTSVAHVFRNFDLDIPIRIELKFEGDDEPHRLTLTVDQSPHPPMIPSVHPQAGNAAAMMSSLGQIALAKIDVTLEGPRERQKSQLIMTPVDVHLDIEHATPPTPAHFQPARGIPDPAWDARNLGELEIRGRVDTVIPPLKILDPRLQSLRTAVVGDQPIIHADIGADRKIPVPYVGEGFSRLLSTLLTMANLRGGVILIDEVCTGIHYSVLPAICRALGQACRDFDCQLIGTTHSYELLQYAVDGLTDLFQSDLSYVRLERVGDEVKAQTYTYEMLKTALENGWEVR